MLAKFFFTCPYYRKSEYESRVYWLKNVDLCIHEYTCSEGAVRG